MDTALPRKGIKINRGDVRKNQAATTPLHIPVLFSQLIFFQWSHRSFVFIEAIGFTF